MASSKRIGFYLSENKFYFVESSDNNLLRVIVSSPFYTVEQSSSEDIRLIALIQKTIREQNLTQTDVRFSIPQSEVIIRSFLIPMMRTNELTSVVDFELRKHIPFDLKDFSYTFNTIQVTDNKVKKLRVLVAATRQLLLERYEQILNQSKLNVIVSEPAPFGLVRVLFAKKVVPPSARFALIHIGQGMGRILFVHEGMVLFIREFQLSQTGVPIETHQEEQLLKARFVNEIQNSLDFFTRAHEQISVQQIIILKDDEERPYDQWLNEEISIPKKCIDVKMLVGTQNEADESGVLYAFGASLADPKVPTIFNLCRKAIKKSPTVKMMRSDVNYKEYTTSIKVGVVAVLILILMFFLFGLRVSEIQKTKQSLSSQQEDMADITTEDIQKKIDKNNIRLKQYFGIIIKNSVTDIFVALSNVTPKGVWLINLNMKMVSSNVKDGEIVVLKNGWEINFSAMVYAKDPKQEIRIVNEYMTKLKKDKSLAKFVKNVTLVSMAQQELNNYKVIMITVRCS